MNSDGVDFRQDVFSLPELFATTTIDQAEAAVVNRPFTREQIHSADGDDFLFDKFADSGAVCCFLRLAPGADRAVQFSVPGGYQLQNCNSGGWLLKPLSSTQPSYWMPNAPVARALDADGHLLHHEAAELVSFDATAQHLGVGIGVPDGLNLDSVLWRLPPDESDLISALESPSVLETQPYFMWSSHTAYSRPADLYLHLVHGHVYENHEVWPRHWRVCSELDAYSLYVALSGVALATGKRLYSLLRQQVVYSVIARQAEDGGWYHGEWTDGMESHYRLVNAAVLMLAAHLEEHEDSVARKSLEKGAAFLATRAHKLGAGAWFMHDSLEGDAEGMRKYPFAWSTSTLGKATTNMLILNTHLDTTIALDRYAEATGDEQYRALVASARESAKAVMGLRPAEWLYRAIFRILDLALLPRDAAERLPLHTRMVKRIGWKYLAPSLHRLKAASPRLVMPNGFIDRSLCQKGFSTRYQSVHIWDLVRYLRRFPDVDIASLLDRAVEYTYQGSIRAHWRESAERQDALGFWVEALYHLCLRGHDPKFRRWLAEAVIEVGQVGLGLPPSVLGANSEAIRPEEQSPCPSPANRGLRVVNLSRGANAEYLVVNVTNHPLPLEWQVAPERAIAWTNQDGQAFSESVEIRVVSRLGWVVGVPWSQ
jgi:hypothetical protein